MDENSSAKLGAHTHKVKNEVTMFILFEFFGCYGFPMFFYSISGLTPKRQHMTRFLFRWSFVGNSSSSLGIETPQLSIVIAPCVQKKTGISMSFPTSGNKLHNAKFMMYFIPPTLFFLFNQHWTFSKSAVHFTFQNVVAFLGPLA